MRHIYAKCLASLPFFPLCLCFVAVFSNTRLVWCHLSYSAHTYSHTNSIYQSLQRRMLRKSCLRTSDTSKSSRQFEEPNIPVMCIAVACATPAQSFHHQARKIGIYIIASVMYSHTCMNLKTETEHTAENLILISHCNSISPHHWHPSLTDP